MGKLDEKTKRFIRFCIVGFSNFVIISTVVAIMMKVLNYDYILSNVCAYAIAITSSFIWNKVWVFRSSGGNVRREATLYVVAFLCAYAAQFLFLDLTVEFLGFNKFAAQFAGLFIFGGVNFSMNRFVTFRSAAAPKMQ